MRDGSIVRQVKALYDDTCMYCETPLVVNADGRRYCEAAHIKPLGQPFDGPDVIENLLVLCPNHHKMFDKGAISFRANEVGILKHSVDEGDGFHGTPLHPRPEHNIDNDFLNWHADHFYF